MNSVEICNAALSMLGIPRITSLDGSSTSAELCRIHYPVLRDRVLRDHLWSFATAFADLQQLAEESPDDRFGFVCSLPVDLIRLVAVQNGGRCRKISGAKLLVECYPARIVYIRRITNPEEFDGNFTEALQYLLAAELCMANTRDANLANFYRQEYERRLAVARSIDSAENIDAYQSHRRSSFIEARFRSGVEMPPLHGLRKIEGDSGIQGK